MRNIIKSYLKSYFKNWIEAIGLIIFLIIVIATSSGILAGVVQYKMEYNKVTAVSKKWDYSYSNVKDGTHYNYQNNFLLYYFTGHILAFSGDKAEIIKPPSSPTQPYWKYFWNDDQNKAIISRFNNKPIFNINSQYKLPNNINPENGFNYIDNELIKDFNLLYSEQPKTIKEAIIPTNNILDSTTPLTTLGFQDMKKFNFNYQAEIVNMLLTPDINKGVIGMAFDYNRMLSPKITKNTKDSSKLKSYFLESSNPQLFGKNVYDVNKLKLYKGTNKETVININSSKKENINIGNNINIGAKKLKISGQGITLDTIIKKISSTITNSNNGVSRGLSPNLITLYTNSSNINSIVSKQDIQLNYNVKEGSEIYFKFDNSNYNQISQDLDKIFIIGETFLSSYNNSPIYLKTNNINISTIMFISITGLSLFLAFIFINFTMKKEMNKTRKQLGIFKAFGYKNRQLSWIFATKFLVTTLIGALVGYFLGFLIQGYAAKIFTRDLLLPFDKYYHGGVFLIFIFVVVPFIFTMISYLLTIFYIKKPILHLIVGNPNKKMNFLGRFFKMIFAKTHFIIRAQISFTFSAFGKFMAVMFVFLFSILLFLFSFGALDVLKSTSSNLFITYNKNVDHISPADSAFNNFKLNPQDGYLHLESNHYLFNQNGIQNTNLYQKYNINNAKNLTSAFHSNYIMNSAGRGIGDVLGDISNFNSIIKDTQKWLKATPVSFQTKFSSQILSNPTKNIYNLILPFLYNYNKPTLLHDNAVQDINTMYNFLNSKFISDNGSINPDAISDCKVKDLNTMLYFILSISNQKLSNGLDNDWTNTLPVKYREIKSTDPSNKPIIINDDKLPVWVKQIATFYNLLGDKDKAIFSFNHMLFQDNLEVPELDYNSLTLTKTDSRINKISAKGLYNFQANPLKLSNNQKMTDYYNFKGVSNPNLIYNQWKYKTPTNKEKTDYTPVNVIVSKLLAKALNWKVGTTHSIKLINSANGDKIDYRITLKVIGIASKDTISQSIYFSADNLSSIFKSYNIGASNQGKVLQNSNGNSIFYNAIVSKIKLFRQKVSISDFTRGKFVPKLYSYNLGVSFLNAFNTVNNVNVNTSSWWEILNGTKGTEISSYDSISNTSILVRPDQTTPIALLRTIISEGLDKVSGILTTMQILTAFTILVILVVVVSAIIDEASNIILTMKSLGYKPWQVNFIVVGNYAISIFLLFIISYFGSLLIWSVVSNVIFSKYAILLSIPLSPLIPITVGSIIISVLILAWIVSNSIVKKKNIKELVE